MKGKEDGIEVEFEGERSKKRKNWDSLHTTVPANLLRNKLICFPHKNPNTESHSLSLI